mmetsp:Transcript_12126/g.31829  ORF Transcript_12126/g.31829 Transcript_12126/m.31829 type:complete len:224 (+) Transcript_12126:142-813(+)
MGARGREGASAGPTVPRTPPHRAWPQSPSWLVFILRHPAALSLARRAPTPGGARSSVTHAMRVTGLARRWTSGNHVRVQHHQHPPVGGRAHPAQNGETRRTRRGLSSVVGHEPRPARVTEPAATLEMTLPSALRPTPSPHKRPEADGAVGGGRVLDGTARDAVVPHRIREGTQQLRVQPHLAERMRLCAALPGAELLPAEPLQVADARGQAVDAAGPRREVSV